MGSCALLKEFTPKYSEKLSGKRESVVMIRWYESLYLDSVTEKKVKRIKHRLEKKKVSAQVYCIALAINEADLFDIYRSNELLFSYYQRRDIKIVGLASSKDNAITMVGDIVNDMYQELGKIDKKAFFAF